MSRVFASPQAALAQLHALGVQASGVADDSRQVRPGDLFVAYPGALSDGRRFIDQAITQGAAAVFWQASEDFVWNQNWRVPQFSGNNLRALCGPLAHAVLAQPSEKISLIGITGTNGKTTISQWLGRAYPKPCAMIGTLGAGFAETLTETGFTTPEATTLARYLADFLDSGARACALEASSIGIEEGRLDGARIDVAVFTNLTRDHLDYHGSMEAYAAAKAALFSWPRLRLAVINIDDPLGRQLVQKTRASKVLSYSQQYVPGESSALIYAENIAETARGLCFRLCTPNGRADLETSLLGRYNLSNLLAVAAVLIDAGLSPDEVAARLAQLSAPVGRLEQIGGHNEPLIVIDFAHTPDALESALTALRGITQARGARLSVIFGCGGDRDRGKRPLMGEIAARLADHVVLTSDNPRGEDPQSILDAIFQSAPHAEICLDRAQAIRRTVLAAHPSDVILLAGKGHEAYQEIAGVRRPFLDKNEAEAALAARTASLGVPA